AAAGWHERRICRTGFRRGIAAAVEKGSRRPGRLERRRWQLARHRLAEPGRQFEPARRQQDGRLVQEREDGGATKPVARCQQRCRPTAYLSRYPRVIARRNYLLPDRTVQA